ncbi:MAG: DUF4382 domain-containing protein [Proteobacteria bacterium]|nr:DUF4382 domain-containing protein [Pseudomonadota bacterium]
MNTFKTGRRAAAAALAGLLALGLAACGGGGGGGGDTASGGTGTLRLAMTDAPACGFDTVNVTVEKVRVHQSSTAADADGGWSEVVLNPARRMDLLSLTNGVLSELGQVALPAGRYTQLRLVLADNSNANPLANSVKPTGEAETALTTPSAQQSGLKMPVQIDVAANQLADFVLDFDACKSVVSAGNSGKYLLKPVISVIPRLVSGVSGRVDASLPMGSTMVSLQDGGVTVRATAPDAAGNFLLQPVPVGTYTFVMTAPGRTTLVVRGVPVTSGSVSTLGTSTLVLAPAASPVGTLAGTVTTASSPVDALTRALQSLSGGPVIELAARPVDSVAGTFRHELPTAAPQVANWAGLAGVPVFAADTTVAGQYSLQAVAGTAARQAGPLTLAPGATVTTTFVFP